MKLYIADTSPYARKARMVVIEKGLKAEVEQVFRNPFEESSDLRAANPLGKVPALVTDGGAVFDSSVICAYLDALAPNPRLYPKGEALWPARTGEALADGVLDAAFAIVMERRREEPQRSPLWLERWQAGILRAADAVETELGGASRWEGDPTIAAIALGAALGYLDFRLPDMDWRTKRPKLTSWFKGFKQRPAMQATVPPQS